MHHPACGLVLATIKLAARTEVSPRLRSAALLWLAAAIDRRTRGTVGSIETDDELDINRLLMAPDCGRDPVERLGLRIRCTV